LKALKNAIEKNDKILGRLHVQKRKKLFYELIFGGAAVIGKLLKIMYEDVDEQLLLRRKRDKLIEFEISQYARAMGKHAEIVSLQPSRMVDQNEAEDVHVKNKGQLDSVEEYRKAKRGCGDEKESYWNVCFGQR
jgi:hypothetical protein